jgi:hypothetical protein
MRDFLLGSWGPQAVAFTKQNPLQVASVVLTALSTAVTLIFGIRGFGGDAGGSSFGDGDGDAGGCGGD